MNKCDFCENLEIQKDLEQIDFNYEYTVSLITRMWTNEKTKSDIIGAYVQDNFKLNYCPECGRKINESTGENNK